MLAAYFISKSLMLLGSSYILAMVAFFMPGPLVEGLDRTVELFQLSDVTQTLYTIQTTEMFFKKWAILDLFYHLFSFFSNKYYIFTAI